MTYKQRRYRYDEEHRKQRLAYASRYNAEHRNNPVWCEYRRVARTISRLRHTQETYKAKLDELAARLCELTRQEQKLKRQWRSYERNEQNGKAQKQKQTAAGRTQPAGSPVPVAAFHPRTDRSPLVGQRTAQPARSPVGVSVDAQGEGGSPEASRR